MKSPRLILAPDSMAGGISRLGRQYHGSNVGRHEVAGAGSDRPRASTWAIVTATTRPVVGTSTYAASSEKQRSQKGRGGRYERSQVGHRAARIRPSSRRATKNRSPARPL